ncbi:MAG: SIR2 family protein [Deltaproteobacteria bacterium]|nr:SIR2 family protein [Deltaproteobacteria bacterium]
MRLGKIDASEICIHTSGNARFLNGQTDPNAHWMRVEQRKFVQKFLEFYHDIELGPEGNFHYETFYDYYRSPLAGESYPETLAKFLGDFRQNNGVGTDNHHLLLDFHHTFNQLIAQLLTKDLKRVHLCKPYGPDYNTFLQLSEELAKTHRVHFHTLNHDLYIEHFAHSDSIQGEIDDGFEELGSTFFAELYDKYERYLVRLSRFTGKFEQRFCLYKLHGSIDHYWFQDDELDLIKLKRQISPMKIFKERKKNGVLQYLNHPTDYFPDFLSGTTSKIERYGDGTYYPIILDHFKNNLQSSNTLITIGYGFSDPRINQFIQDGFLTDDSKTLFVVDVRKPDTPFLTRNNVFFVGGGVSGMNTKLILENMNP